MTERQALPYDWSKVRELLQASLWNLLDKWGLRHELRERPSGGKIFPRSPFRTDRHAGSFVIWTDGEAAGAFKDYAVATDKGDILDLVGRMEKLAGKMDVYWWALDWLGLDRKGNTARPRTTGSADLEKRRRESERLAAEARQRSSDTAKSKALFRLWLSCSELAGTPAETYLRQARGIPLERLRALPGALRWARKVEWIDPETGEVITWENVMVSAMTRGPELVAVHRTYLKPDGSGKADVAKAKKMSGPVSGAAIRLSAGPSGLSPSMAMKRSRFDPLAIGEGIETSLTVACARPDYRVWAAGSLSLIGLLDWPRCASAVVLLRDNDWKPAAREEFARVEAHWARQAEGRPLHVVAASVGSDFNDMVRT